MAQILTVCRIGAEWGFRDVTGEAYGHSIDIEKVVEAAHHMAGRVDGSRVAFTDEAERHLHAVRFRPLLTQKDEIRRIGFAAFAAFWRVCGDGVTGDETDD